MPEYGRVIDHKNFLLETQKIVEREYDKTENKPKAFIGDLAPKLIEKALAQSPETFLDLADVLDRGLKGRDVQFYFIDETLERAVQKNGWSGEIKPADKDYLMAVNTNIGGGKTDAVIKERIDVNVVIDPKGTVTNTVTITRTHEGTPEEDFSGVNNVNYLRLYVPKGSQLIEASGFDIPRSTLFETPDPDWVVDADLLYADDSFLIDEGSGTQIYEEAGKTVFGNFTQTAPGETTTTRLSYTLPFTFADIVASRGWLDSWRRRLGFSESDTYSLLVQKQSGVLNRTTTIRVHVPDELRALWSSDKLSHTATGNEQDLFFAAIFEPNKK
jgi:hypothetical protein